MDPALDRTAVVHPSAVLNEAGGRVVLGEAAQVGALAVLEGPCYVGPHSVVAPRALIRRNSVIGPRCKVAGEISFSVIHGHSNKAHDGFLGHTLVGEQRYVFGPDDLRPVREHNARIFVQ